MLLTLLALALVAVAPAGATAAPDESTAFQVNPGHTGFASGGSLEAPPLSARWTRALGTSSSYPLVAGGRVYVIAYDAQHSGGTLFALDPLTGGTLWRRAVDGRGQMAYDAGRLFVAEYSGIVVAVDAATGVTDWARTLPQPYGLRNPVAAGGTVYVDSAWSGGNLYALAEADGSTTWTASFYSDASPALDGTFVYVSDDYEGATQAFSRVDGSLAWTGSLQCFVGSGNALADGARVIGPYNYACGGLSDAATGRQTNSIASNVPPASAGDVVVVLDGTTLQGRSLSTGLLLWQSTGDGSLASAPLIVNGTVYEGSLTGTLFALDLSTGKPLWSGMVAAGASATLAGDAGMAAGAGLLVVPAGGTLTGLASTRVARPGLDLAISGGPDGPTRSNSATFDFASSAPPVGQLCRLDSAEWTACAGTLTFTGLPDGPHMFEVQTQDATDGSVVALAARGWSVDQKVPTATISAGPPASTTSTIASFTITGDTPGARFECRLDAGAWTECPTAPYQPTQYQGLVSGRHLLEVRARNALGSVQAVPTTWTWTIGSTPDTLLAATPPTLSAQAAATFLFVATVPATFECRLDDGAWNQCSSPTSLGALADGPHAFDVRAVNLLGTADPTPAAWTWTVDTHAPRTSVSLDPSSAPAVGYRFAFSASEATATFGCQLDAGAWTPCYSGVLYSGLTAGAHQFTVRATDAAGNTDAQGASLAFLVPATSRSNASSTPARTVDSSSGEPLARLSTPALARMAADAGAALLRASTRRQLRSSPVLRLYSAGPGRISLAVIARTGGRSLNLAGAQAGFSAGGVRPVHLRLTAAGLRALTRSGKLSLRITATVSPVAGPAASASARSRV
ncbi:MAG: PQQ-binding-like beta-propeller repeat protein [Solirubrobacteraceae bacterium]